MPILPEFAGFITQFTVTDITITITPTCITTTIILIALVQVYTPPTTGGGHLFLFPMEPVGEDTMLGIAGAVAGEIPIMGTILGIAGIHGATLLMAMGPIGMVTTKGTTMVTGMVIMMD